MRKQKKIFVMIMLVLCIISMSVTVSAYIRRGTVGISVDREKIELKPGESCQVSVTLDPEQDDQMPGCGMADCPDECGKKCLSENGNCTCDITAYKTYYTNVEIKIDAPEIVEVAYEDGIAVFTALAPGETNVNLAARLREYTGSSVDIAVTVTESGLPVGIITGITAAGAAIIILSFLFIRKRKL